MAQDRIMLLGAGGQVGQTFAHVFDHMNNKPNWEVGYFTRQDLDMTDTTALRFAIQKFEPSLIVNCAAMSHVEPAQQNEEAATAINFHAVAALAGLACAIDAPIIHLSTDFVFEGRKKTPFTTTDQMNPLNIYGGTKMMGEEALRYAMPWHVILRVSSIIGPFGDGILPRTIKMLSENDEIHMVTDRISCPTPALDLAKALISICTQLLHGKADGYGTFHFCGKSPCSRYELTKEIMRSYAPFTDHRTILKEAASNDFPEHVARPPYSVLDCAKIKRIYDIDQPIWQDTLHEAITLLQHKEEPTTSHPDLLPND